MRLHAIGKYRDPYRAEHTDDHPYTPHHVHHATRFEYLLVEYPSMKRRRVPTSRASEPLPTNPYEAAILGAELGTPVPEIDLHGLSIADAIREIDIFLHQHHPKGLVILKIIHGRGEQKLHDNIHAWLHKHHTQIAYFRDAQAPQQHGGVTYVVLRALDRAL